MEEDQVILRLNVDRYRRLLEAESDPGKRRQIMGQLYEAEAAIAGLYSGDGDSPDPQSAPDDDQQRGPSAVAKNPTG